MATTRVPKIESIRNRTIREMKRLGTHRPEYNRLIDIYAGLIQQYLLAVKEFEEGGYVYEVPTARGGSKKSGIISTMENLRKDILQYSDRLCLNPKSLETVTTESAGKSKLAAVLDRLNPD